MKLVIQRVSSAECIADGTVTGKIERGLLVFVGVENDDTDRDINKAVDKIVNLRIFKNEEGKLSLSTRDIGGGVLLISNFTLCGDCKKGRRPEFLSAAGREKALADYEVLRERIAEFVPVALGKFGATMQITAVNDGPINIILDTKQL